MTLFKNKYRVESTRLKNWNYAAKGSYFITLCTKNRECLFGEIINDEMRLNHYGDCIRDEWLKSFELRLELFCEEFVIMPNHIHGIIKIANPPVETHGRASLRNGIAYRPKQSISSFVAGFKSAATKLINQIRQTPGLPVWQRNFYEHIIRTDDELNEVRQYIQNNPIDWEKDENHVK